MESIKSYISIDITFENSYLCFFMGMVFFCIIFIFSSHRFKEYLIKSYVDIVRCLGVCFISTKVNEVSGFTTFHTF